MTRERISRILELKEMFLSFQTAFNFVSAAVVCALLESILVLEPSSDITEPRYFKLVPSDTIKQSFSLIKLVQCQLDYCLILYTLGWGGGGVEYRGQATLVNSKKLF